MKKADHKVSLFPFLYSVNRLIDCLRYFAAGAMGVNPILF